MSPLRRHRQFTRLMSVALIGTFLHGCTSWRTQAVYPREFTSETRVSLASGADVLLDRVVISSDSLVGWRDGERMAIPLAQIRSVATHQVNPVATALAVVGVGLTLLVVAAAVSLQGHSGASCPVVYTWDGTDWRLDSGTFGGAIVRTLTRTDVDNLDFAAPRRDLLGLRLANEMNETDYVDAVSVLAVDHDRDVAVAPDADGGIHTLGPLVPPTRAHDFRGRDALARVRAADGWNWESVPTGRDTARAADLRDGLELMFPRPPGAETARLAVDANNTPWAALMLIEFLSAHGRATQAWYDSLEMAPQRAQELGAALAREAFLTVSLWANGGWQSQGLIWEAGPAVAKRQVVPIDLAGVRGDTVRVRLESVPSFWLVDRVTIDFSPERAIHVRELQVDRAVDRRGQDVRDLLGEVDGRTYSMEPGDRAELSFRVPDAPRGQVRSYLLRSTGWYRIHTPEVGEPNVALLRRVGVEPGAVSRLAVARMNEALRAMEVANR